MDSHSTTVMLLWVIRDKPKREWQGVQTSLRISPSRLIPGETEMPSKELTFLELQVVLISVSLLSITELSLKTVHLRAVQ